jgi:hypothetical protein
MAGNGTALYLFVQRAQHRDRALEALNAAQTLPPASQKLTDLLLALDPEA